MPAPEAVFQLDLNPELSESLKEIARQQGELPETICNLIQELRDMIFEKGDFVPPTMSNEFLIKFLRARFCNVQHAYRLLNNYCSFREANRELHEKVHPLDLLAIGDHDIVSVLPYTDQTGRRIMIFRFGNWNPSKSSVDEVFKAALLLLETGSLEPSGQILGGVGIFDLTGLTFNHMLHLTPSVAQKMIALMVTSLPLRTTAIHVVYQNWLFNAAFQIFKPFLNARMRDKIYVHGSDMSSLHQHIEPDYLPQRYGGVHPDYPYRPWLENLAKQEEVIKAIAQLGYSLAPREGLYEGANIKEDIK